MDNKILPTDEYSTFEDRVYINPTLGVNSTTQFIDNLRNIQQANNAEVNQQTQSLGTDIASNLGGLTGAQSYWTSRYQTPQTNSAIADLRATAQATALNEVLANEKAKWQKRYNEAYRNYQKRSWDKQNSGGGGGDDDEETNPDFESTSSTVEPASLTGREGYYSITDPASGQIIDVPLDESSGGQVRDKDRYQSPGQAGYVLLGTPWRGAGYPGQHVYNTPSGETLYVNLEEGYKIMYDTETGKLVQVKE